MLTNTVDDNRIAVKTIPIDFDRSKIHLDCVFNTLNRENCLITDDVYDIDIIQKHMINCYKLDKAATDELGANIVFLGDRKMITSSKSTNELLKNMGFDS